MKNGTWKFWEWYFFAHEYSGRHDCKLDCCPAWAPDPENSFFEHAVVSCAAACFGILGILGLMVGTVLGFVTCPIWVGPYLLYRWFRYRDTEPKNERATK